MSITRLHTHTPASVSYPTCIQSLASSPLSIIVNHLARCIQLNIRVHTTPHGQQFKAGKEALAIVYGKVSEQAMRQALWWSVIHHVIVHEDQLIHLIIYLRSTRGGIAYLLIGIRTYPNNELHMGYVSECRSR